MKDTFFLSECGGYITRSLGGGDFEAWSIDGVTHWKKDDRVKTWADAAKRRHPLPFCVGGYSALHTGQKKGSFTVMLLDCDTKKYIKPWKGNTVIQSRDIVFRRKVPSGHYAAWKRKLGIV